MKKYEILINGNPIHFKDGRPHIYVANDKNDEKELQNIVRDYNHPRIVSEGIQAELVEIK